MSLLPRHRNPIISLLIASSHKLSSHLLLLEGKSTTAKAKDQVEADYTRDDRDKHVNKYTTIEPMCSILVSASIKYYHRTRSTFCSTSVRTRYNSRARVIVFLDTVYCRAVGWRHANVFIFIRIRHLKSAKRKCFLTNED